MILRSISLDRELNEKLQEYCKNNSRTFSALVSVLLNKCLQENENETNKKQNI